MGEAAIKAARAVGYFNAGTVEFIFQDNEFFFLEMNTRLQVEHPVTEAITGIDLVEWQIRVASGETLPMTQAEIDAVRRGHAIEVRINAEDPAGGKFLPSPGKIETLRAPDGFGVRFDAGYEAGDEVSQYYDNLVGKLIVWGKDRATAIARTIRALEEMEITGVATTIPADLAILRHPDFQNVTHSTKWSRERLDLSGVSGKVAAPEQTEEDAAPLVQRSTTVEVNGKRFDVKMWVPDQPLVVAGGAGAKAAPKSRKSSGGSGGGGAGSGDVVVPMQGTIVKVLVEVGQAVEAGQAVVVLEAMKMENQIQAEKAGTVKAIKVEAGATVDAATSWSSSSDPGPPGRRDRAHGPADRDGDRPGRGRPSTGPAQVTPGLVARRTTTVPATKRPVTPGLVAGTPPPCRRDQTPGRTRFGRRRTTTVSARPNARSHPVWSPGAPPCRRDQTPGHPVWSGRLGSVEDDDRAGGSVVETLLAGMAPGQEMYDGEGRDGDTGDHGGESHHDCRMNDWVHPSGEPSDAWTTRHRNHAFPSVRPVSATEIPDSRRAGAPRLLPTRTDRRR
ncbi:MAG: biotin/lipoyl-containing protein [Ilumatobacteraceae bacterium]